MVQKRSLTMRLKSQQSSTNQRLNKTHVVAIPVVLVICCLLTHHQVGGYVTRLGRAAKSGAENKANTIDDDAYHRPHFTAGRSVLVQLFEWKFVDVAEECRTFLGPQGYAGVQLSPVLEHTVIKAGNLQHPWWQRYEIVSYRFASRSGDEAEFWSMSRICNDHGVRIYMDVVLNHMAAPLHTLLNETTAKEDFVVNTLLANDVNISSNLVYPNVPYTAKEFHRPCAIPPSPNAHEIRNCQLNGHPDLDHYHTSVKEAIVVMLNKFIDMGVAGFRIDTAKHIWPIDLKYICAELKDLSKDFNFEDKARPFIYHDVFDIGLDAVSKTEYSTYGVVSEYLYAVELSHILNGKAPLSSLINWGPPMGFLPHQDSLIFIDSHDTQRGLPQEMGSNNVVTYKQRNKYIMANALMLAHPYGRIKRIMSSYYFDKKDIHRGPPTEEGDDDVIRSPQFNDQQQCIASSGWVCEHRWPPLVQLVAMANYFSIPDQDEKSIIHFQTNGPNQIAFCRGHKAFVAINNDKENDFVKEVFTCLEEGVYCDIISGGLKKGGKQCHGRSLEVNAEGYARLNLPVADDNLDESEGIAFMQINEEEGRREEGNVVASFGVLVVYEGSKIGMDQVVEVMMMKGNIGNEGGESESGVENNGNGEEQAKPDNEGNEEKDPEGDGNNDEGDEAQAKPDNEENGEEDPAGEGNNDEGEEAQAKSDNEENGEGDQPGEGNNDDGEEEQPKPDDEENGEEDPAGNDEGEEAQANPDNEENGEEAPAVDSNNDEGEEVQPKPDDEENVEEAPAVDGNNDDGEQEEALPDKEGNGEEDPAVDGNNDEGEEAQAKPDNEENGEVDQPSEGNNDEGEEAQARPDNEENGEEAPAVDGNNDEGEEAQAKPDNEENGEEDPTGEGNNDEGEEIAQNEQSESTAEEVPSEGTGEDIDDPSKETQNGEEVPNEEAEGDPEVPVEELSKEEAEIPSEGVEVPEAENPQHESTENIETLNEDAAEEAKVAEGETQNGNDSKDAEVSPENEETAGTDEETPNEEDAKEAETPMEEPPNEEEVDEVANEESDKSKETENEAGNSPEATGSQAVEEPEIPVEETANEEAGEEAINTVDESINVEVENSGEKPAGEEPEIPVEESSNDADAEEAEGAADEPPEEPEVPAEENPNNEAGEEAEIPSEDNPNEGAAAEEEILGKEEGNTGDYKTPEGEPVEDKAESVDTEAEESNDEPVQGEEAPNEEILSQEPEEGNETPKEATPSKEDGEGAIDPADNSQNMEANGNPIVPEEEVVGKEMETKETETIPVSKPTVKPPDEKIDKRQTEYEDGNDNSEQQVERPLSEKDLTEVKAIADEVTNKIQETISNSTIEIVNHINDIQTPAAVRTEEIASAGFFSPKQKQSGNG